MKYCNKPDRDVPEIICGFPIPCPYHTVIIDLKENPPMIKVPATEIKHINRKNLNRIKKIANILKED